MVTFHLEADDGIGDDAGAVNPQIQIAAVDRPVGHLIAETGEVLGEAEVDPVNRAVDIGIEVVALEAERRRHIVDSMPAGIVCDVGRINRVGNVRVIFEVGDLGIAVDVATGFQHVGVDRKGHLAAVRVSGDEIQIQVGVVIELPAVVAAGESAIEDDVLGPVHHDGFDGTVNIVVKERDVVDHNRSRPVSELPATGGHAVYPLVCDVAVVVGVADVRFSAAVDTGFVLIAFYEEPQGAVVEIPVYNGEAHGVGIETPILLKEIEIEQVFREFDFNEIDRTVDFDFIVILKLVA